MTGGSVTNIILLLVKYRQNYQLTAAIVVIINASASIYSVIARKTRESL